MTIHKY